MKSDNLPTTPYISASCKRRCANPKITELAKIQGGKIVSKPKMPDRTGYKTDRLQVIEGFKPKLSQQF